MAPASIRYKNPGAMWPGPVATKWGSKRWVYLNDGTGQGGGGHGNKIAIFEQFADGIGACLQLWRGPRYANKKFSQAIAVWSGGNHVESYIKFVLDRVPGMKRDQIMSDAFLNSPMGVLFMKAQAWHEAGQRYPAADAEFVAAQRRMFGGVKPKAGPVAKTTGAGTAGTGTTGTLVQSGMNPLTALLIGVGVAVVVFVGWKLWQNYKSKSDATPLAPLPAPTVQDEHTPSGIVMDSASGAPVTDAAGQSL